MLFDLFDIDKKEEFKYWVKKLHFIASVLQYDYFKLWELPEYEIGLLENFAIEEINYRKKRQEEIKEITNNIK